MAIVELRRVALRGLQSRQCDRADFPGAITAARSLDEALARAGEALALHVEGMAEDGEPIPSPSGFAEVIKDNPDDHDGPRVVPARTNLAARVKGQGRWQSRNRRRIPSHRDHRPNRRDRNRAFENIAAMTGVDLNFLARQGDRVVADLDARRHRREDCHHTPD